MLIDQTKSRDGFSDLAAVFFNCGISQDRARGSWPVTLRGSCRNRMTDVSEFPVGIRKTLDDQPSAGNQSIYRRANSVRHDVRKGHSCDVRKGCSFEFEQLVNVSKSRLGRIRDDR
jgi:hypothetical protein